MRKSSIGKRFVASACTLALAISMPAMAFAGDEPETQEGGVAVEQAADETPATNTTFDNTSNTVTSVITGEGAVTDADATNEEYSVSVDYTVSDEEAANVEAAITDGTFEPVIEEVAAPSDAFDKALKGELKGDQADYNLSADDYITAKSFEVKTPEASGATKTVTVVYTAGDNATELKCVVYITITKANGDIETVVAEATNNGDGTFTYAAADGVADGAVMTFVLSASTDASAATTTKGNTIQAGENKDGDKIYDVTFNATQSANNGDGKQNWKIDVTTTLDGLTDAQIAALTATNVISATNTQTPAAAFANESQATLSQYEPGALSFVIASTEGDVKSANVTLNVGKQYAGRSVTVYGQGADGILDEQYVTIDPNGNIVLPVTEMGTYTFAIAKGSTPVVPGDPDQPSTPDQPVDPDNPRPVIPGDEGFNGGDEGDGAAADGNGVTASDNGKTSPKTGIF